MKIMKAHIGDPSYLDKPGYFYEPKLDGYRALCYVNTQTKLISRNNQNFNAIFPELTHFRKNVSAQSCILDGEIVAYDKAGNPNFSLLTTGHKATYVVFDILSLNQESLLHKPLQVRKQILEQVIQPGNGLERMIFTQNGRQLWQVLKNRKLEGVMAKKINGNYYPGKRSTTWMKIKFFNTIDCIIVGYVNSSKRIISSLVLALYNNKKQLQYIGNVGTGFNAHELLQLEKMLIKIRVDQLFLITNRVSSRQLKQVYWVEPKYVCEVKFQELTPYNILRIPVFLRLRNDKEPAECTVKDQLQDFET